MHVGRLNFLWLLGVFQLMTPAVMSAPADDLARQGNQLYQQERYEEAIAAYRQALEKDPDSARIQYNLGSALAKSGKYGDAEQVLRQTATRPGSGVQGDSYYNLGVSVVKSTEAAGREAGAAQAGSSSSYEDQFAPQMQIARLEQALGAFREAMMVDPKDQEARFNYEVTLRKIEKLREQMEQQQQQQSGGQNQNKDQQGQNQENNQGKQDESQNQQNKDQNAEQKPQAGENEQQEKQGEDQSEKPEPGDAPQQEEEQRDKQDEGLNGQQEEPKATPQPTPAPRQESAQQTGTGEKGQKEEELTPEQMDALRLLNLLNEEQPEQFKRLFQFRGRLEPPPGGKDW